MQQPRQDTGAITRLYHRKITLPAKTGPVPPDLDPTQILPAITTVSNLAPLYRAPRFVEIRRVDNPLVMLYSAIIEAIEKLGAMPEALYISSSLEKELRQAAVKAGVSLTSRAYKFFSIHGIHFIPVKTETELPEILRIALGGQIGRDTVIATCG